MESGKLILLLGGVRSGKSRFAQVMAAELSDRVCYIATAQPCDGEMRDRIVKHRAERPASWQTVEAPTRVGDALRKAAHLADVVVLDCVTLLVANVLMEQESLEPVRAEVADLLAARKESEVTVIAVSNEVGMGVVPPYPLGRIYRDALGEANQSLARAAESVYLMVAGLAIEIKQSGLGKVVGGRESSGE